MDKSELNIILKNLNELVLPQKEKLVELLATASMILEGEENLLEIEGDCVVIGDLHGHFFYFLNMLELVNKNSKLVFLGDYVDRGFNSVELLIYLVIMKILEPERIIILRGNNYHHMISDTKYRILFGILFQTETHKVIVYLNNFIGNFIFLLFLAKIGVNFIFVPIFGIFSY